MPLTTRNFLYQQLQRLDLLLHREILRLRARYQLSLDEFRGLYVSDEQVDALINESMKVDRSLSAIQHLTEQAAHLQKDNSELFEQAPEWKHIIQEFNLSPFEQDVLLLALAPELDLKYETLYGYLNNDITRKYPTVDLALRICGAECPDDAQFRGALTKQAPLFDYGLLEPLENHGGTRSSLGNGFSIAPLVANYVLGLPVQGSAFNGFLSLHASSEDSLGNALPRIVQERVKRWAILAENGQGPQRLVLKGRDGAGRGQATATAALALGWNVLAVDAKKLLDNPGNFRKQLQQILLLARLKQAMIHLKHGELLFTGESATRRLLHEFFEYMSQKKLPVSLNVYPDTPWQEILQGTSCVCVQIPDPTTREREQVWQTFLEKVAWSSDKHTARELAQRFQLTPGKIRHAVMAADLEQRLRSNGKDLKPKDILFQAARDQSVGEIGKLAKKVQPKFSWEDLILSETTYTRIMEIAAAVRNQQRVYHEWGMANRVNNANGLMVLFAGPSGTGKTMTASVIAKELGIDLYRIDLAGIVSKYIGETEKNLDRIFNAACNANSILFFDEADALFGKRSEVKDAHDRYANIETAYLLQKMEEHEGLVILATNLSKNMDQAFSRRMHYVVEFPKPDAVQRERLWQKIFPEEAPLSDNVDFGFLSRQFPLTGGDIKNVALDAAFLAAQNGQLLTMPSLIQAMSRQMIKQGKVPSAADFKHYHILIEQQN